MSNSFDTDSTRVMHVAVLAVFSFLALVAVIFRLWARKVQRSRLEINDYLCIVGLVFALSLSVFTMHSYIYWDLGGNPTQLGTPNAILALVILQIKAMLTGEVLWTVSVFFIRASVLQLYIRIFRTRPFRMTCYVVHAFNAAYSVSTIFATCLVCRPLAYNWDSSIPGGVCGDQKSLDLFIGIFNLLMDVAVVILPMPVLWGLQMATAKKLVLSGMFGMGIVICIITLIRVWITTLIHGQNAQSIYSLIALFTCLEALLGVINACLPVMKPVFTQFGNSRIWTWASSLTSTTRRSIVRSTAHRHSAGYRKESKPKHATNDELRNLPKIQSPPRYVHNKAAGMMFSHLTTSPMSPDARVDHPAMSPPRVPPKSKKDSTPRGGRWVEKNMTGVEAQRHWDVEKGFGDNTDRIPLKESAERTNGWRRG